MTFYNIDPNTLPSGAQYYFDVLVYNIAISVDYADELFDDDILDIWYLDKITDAQPIAVHFYVQDEFDPEELELDDECEDYSDVDYAMQALYHQVVEVHPTLGVSLYDMTDYETRGIWGFD